PEGLRSWPAELRSPPAEPFSKREVLLNEICEFLLQTKDITISTRQVEKFSILLNNHLALGHRRFLDARTLFSCTQGCFGRGIAERLHCHLASYYNHIAAERVRPRQRTEKSLFVYSLDETASEHGFESRECNPTPPSYDFLPREMEPKAGNTPWTSYS